MTKRLILVRHGRINCDVAGAYIGKTDIPLSVEGLDQAEAVAKRLQAMQWDRWFCSPMKRCQDMLEALKPTHPGFTLEDLKEIDFGDWEGKTFDDIAASWPQLVDQWAGFAPGFRFPEGDAPSAFFNRVGIVVEQLLRDEAENLLVITHGGVIRFMLCRLLGLPMQQHLIFSISPASITTVDIHEGRGRLLHLNDTCHLEGI